MGVKQVTRQKFTRITSLLLTRFTTKTALQVAVKPFLTYKFTLLLLRISWSWWMDISFGSPIGAFLVHFFEAKKNKKTPS